MVRPKKKNNGQQSEMNRLVHMMSELLSRNGNKTKAVKQRRRRPRRGKTASVANEGTITLNRSELLTKISIPVTLASNKGKIDIFPSSFSFLKNISSSFDRLIWNSLKIYYKPAIGTAYGGLVSVGMDWDFIADEIDRKAISSLTPNISTAAWQDTETKPLVLPQSRLQSRKYYFPNNTKAGDVDRGPGRLHWAVEGTSNKDSGTVLGEIWATYSVTMQGTNPA